MKLARAFMKLARLHEIGTPSAAEKGPCCLRFTKRMAILLPRPSLELTDDSGLEQGNGLALADRTDRANGEKTI